MDGNGFGLAILGMAIFALVVNLLLKASDVLGAIAHHL